MAMKPKKMRGGGMIKKMRGGGMAGKPAVGMAAPGGKLPPSRKVPTMVTKAPLGAPGTKRPSTGRSGAQAQGGPGSARSMARLAAMARGMNLGPNRPKPTKATAMRGAAGRRSGGSTPPGMNMGGAAMKSKMASKGGKMGGMMPPGYKNGGTAKKKSARGVGAAKRGFGRAMR